MSWRRLLSNAIRYCWGLCLGAQVFWPPADISNTVLHTGEQTPFEMLLEVLD